jgi:glycosyltransferase involved in cell wall biosynthesis
MWEWATAAYQAGCDVVVLYDRELDGRSLFRNPAIPTLALDHAGAGRIRLPRGLAGCLEPDDVLVLHSVYLPGNIRAAWSARRRGVPYVVMPHGGYNKQSRRRRARRKQAWLPIERAYLERALGVHLFFDNETSDAADVAPNARWIVAATGFAPRDARWDGGSGGYLAWVGRYDIRTKGLDLLVEAMGRLPEGHGRRLRTHGRQSENSFEDLRVFVREAGLEDIVTVGGELTEEEKVDFLRRAVAYVHPSRWESHSLAIVEALSYGIPTVISTVCSIAPAVRRADAAVVIEPNPEDIARGITTLLRNPHEYSARAIDFVRTRLGWSSTISDYLGQLESLRKGARTRARG